MPCVAQAEPSRSEASGGGGSAAEGTEEGMWVPEEFLEHEAAARELNDDATAIGGEGEGLKRGSRRVLRCLLLLMISNEKL